MKFLMHSTEDISSDLFFNQKKYSLCLIGKEIDDRGRAACDFAKSHSHESIKIEYFPKDFEVQVEGNGKLDTDTFLTWLEDKVKGLRDPVLLETTTLDFSEIFFCIQGLLKKKDLKIDFLYLEPQDYLKVSDPAKRVKESKVKSSFALSEKLGDFISIPGAVVNIDGSIPVKKGIFFLGYEDHRFDRIFQEWDGERPAEKCPVVFGVPPFQAGWELNSFSANVRVLDTRNIDDGVYFCPANNPYAAYQILHEQYMSIDENQKMFVSPLGTKPESIGIAAFLAEKSLIPQKKAIGVLYDHPKRKDGRSESVFRWHMYEVVR